MPSVTDAALTARVTETDIFVRISPDRALRRNGYTVGFLGDGINDAPAIHVADVGVSVDGGTDVARAAADIILLLRSSAFWPPVLRNVGGPMPTL